MKEKTQSWRIENRVQVLEEKVDELTKRICWLEQGEEERRSSSSEDMEKNGDGKVAVGVVRFLLRGM